MKNNFIPNRKVIVLAFLAMTANIYSESIDYDQAMNKIDKVLVTGTAIAIHVQTAISGAVYV